MLPFLLLQAAVAAAPQIPDRPYELDFAADTKRQVIVDREPNQYLGHVSTLLLEDGKTILAVYPKGHGKGAILLKRSEDGGRTWSERLPVPASWATSLETPTIHRVIDPSGKKSLIVWSGLYPARIARSEDDGKTWSELEKVGDWGGIVVMGDVVALHEKGCYTALFHDDGRFLANGGKATGTFTLLASDSVDAGRSWSAPRALWSGKDMHLCEPGAIRSPNGAEITLLLRENRRKQPSQTMTSKDEGKTWSSPEPMHPALTGDRHTARYAKDGRVVVVFRDMGLKQDNLTKGDFVRILKEPKNALTKQYQALFEAEGVKVTFDAGAINEIADMAFTINAEIENIGARRLHTVMSRLLREFLFDVPDKIVAPADITITQPLVKEKLAGLLNNKDLSEYIL